MISFLNAVYGKRMLGKMRTKTLYWYIGVNTMVKSLFLFVIMKVACIRSMCASNYYGRWKITHTVFQHCKTLTLTLKICLPIIYIIINLNTFISSKNFEADRINVQNLWLHIIYSKEILMFIFTLINFSRLLPFPNCDMSKDVSQKNHTQYIGNLSRLRL